MDETIYYGRPSIVTSEKQEEIIHFYVIAKYLWLRGEIAKVSPAIAEKARQIRVGVATAWRIIKYARESGMIYNIIQGSY